MVPSAHFLGKAGNSFPDVIVNGISDSQITAYVNHITANSLEMVDALGVPSCGDHNFYVFGESFRQPKGNVSLLSCLTISKSVDSFNHNNHLFINFLSAVNNLLLFNFRTDDVQPIGKKLPDILLEKINTLLQLECLFKFDYDLV